MDKCIIPYIHNKETKLLNHVEIKDIVTVSRFRVFEVSCCKKPLKKGKKRKVDHHL